MPTSKSFRENSAELKRAQMASLTSGSPLLLSRIRTEFSPRSRSARLDSDQDKPGIRTLQIVAYTQRENAQPAQLHAQFHNTKIFLALLPTFQLSLFPFWARTLWAVKCKHSLYVTSVTNNLLGQCIRKGEIGKRESLKVRLHDWDQVQVQCLRSSKYMFTSHQKSVEDSC